VDCNELLIGRHFVAGPCHPSIRVGELALRTLKKATVQLVTIGVEAVHRFFHCIFNQLVCCLHFFTHDTVLSLLIRTRPPGWLSPATAGRLWCFSSFHCLPDCSGGSPRDAGNLVTIPRMTWNAFGGAPG